MNRVHADRRAGLVLLAVAVAASAGLFGALGVAQVEDCTVYRLAAERVQMVPPDALAGVGQGTAVAVSGWLAVPESLSVSDDPFVPPIRAFALERRIQVLASRFQRTPSTPGSRYRSPERSLQRAESAWTWVETDPLAPQFAGTPLASRSQGEAPDALGMLDLGPDDQQALVWAPVPLPEETRTWLASQGYSLQPDAPGWWMAESGLVRIGWFALEAQPLTLLGVRATSPFTGKPILAGGSVAGLDWPRRVVAGTYNPNTALRRDHDHCLARTPTFGQRLRIGLWPGLGAAAIVLLLAWGLDRWNRSRRRASPLDPR